MKKMFALIKRQFHSLRCMWKANYCVDITYKDGRKVWMCSCGRVFWEEK